MPGCSPSNYVLGNPLRFVDPDGMQVGEYDDERRRQQELLTPQASTNSTLLDRVVNLFKYSRFSFSTANSPVEQAQKVTQTAGEIANQSEEAAVEMVKDGSAMVADGADIASDVTGIAAIGSAVLPCTQAATTPLAAASFGFTAISGGAKLIHIAAGGEQYSFTDIAFTGGSLVPSTLPLSDVTRTSIGLSIGKIPAVIELSRSIRLPVHGQQSYGFQKTYNSGISNSRVSCTSIRCH